VTTPLEAPFLDITSNVITGGERGLLGLAFHPEYKTNRRFFVNYTRRPDGSTVVSEFKSSLGDPNLAETEERIILTIPQPAEEHNGGWMGFGPDGYLYITTGDGGPGSDPNNRAQNNKEPLGKILRVDVNADGSSPYASPSTNPFVGSTSGRDEIFATGFRNPWRCSFDRATGKLYAGDVGEGVIEEIDIVEPGGNYGCRVFEGSRCAELGPVPCEASHYIPPIVEYDHFTNGRCAITGGYVYRGTRNSLPAGGYVFGDFCSGEIFLAASPGGAKSISCLRWKDRRRTR
jgi:glucose/arabinose dehydrogenase